MPVGWWKRPRGAVVECLGKVYAMSGGMMRRCDFDWESDCHMIKSLELACK